MISILHIVSVVKFKRVVYGQIATIVYPAHAAFGGYKASGIGRENHLDDVVGLPTNEKHAC